MKVFPGPLAGPDPESPALLSRTMVVVVDDRAEGGRGKKLGEEHET